MANDDDIIYVDVAARLDEAAADQATSRLRDKFKRTKIPVEPDLDEQAADRATGRLREKFRGAGQSLRDALSDALEDSHLDDAADKASKKLGNRFKGLGDALGKTLADELGNALGLSGAGVGSSLDKLFKDKFGGLAGALSGKDSDDILGAFDNLKGELRDAATGLRELAPEGSRAAKGLVAVADAAGPLAATFLALQKFNNMVDPQGGQRHWDDVVNPPTLPGQQPPGNSFWDKFWRVFKSWVPGGDPRLNGPPKPPSPPSGGWWGYGSTARGPGNFLPSLPGAVAQPPGGMQTPSFAPPDTGGTVGTRSAFTGGGIRATLVDYTHPDAPDISSPSDIPGAAGGVANLFRVAESLQGTPYSQALRNDCSGMVSKLANAALGLPPVASFSTVNEGQWLGAHGFQQGMGGPGDLSIGWYDHGGGNAGHTAATLPGGVHAESGGTHGAFALGSGAAGADSPQFDHHMFLPMGAGGGGGGGFRAAPVGFGPPGLGGLGGGGMGPLPPPTQANQGGGSTQQQPLGHGQGVGVSGGGILGAAEQAGVMAAAIGGFGGGGIAAQMAEQEMNLAIQKGGQIAATMAAMPFETFGLTGGQMGAPTVQPMGGWPGKLIGGLIGQQTNLPNIAGGTQKPKQPDQKDGQQDPAGGNPPAGPSGSKDDPIHTRPADGAPQPGPGAMNSAANFTAMAGVTAL